MTTLRALGFLPRSAISWFIDHPFDLFSCRSSYNSGTQTGEETPNEYPRRASRQVHPPPPPLAITAFPAYHLTLTQQSRNYFADIRSGVKNNAENRPHIRVREHRGTMYIDDGRETIFSCTAYGHSARCVLLELHDAGYDVRKWMEKRTRGGYDNWPYQSNPSPPEDKYK